MSRFTKITILAFLVTVLLGAFYSVEHRYKSIRDLPGQTTPIPEASPEFSIGATKPTPSRVDLYLDPHCIDSKEFFEVFDKLLDTTVEKKKLRDSIEVYLHYIALPYHVYSFYAITALKYLAVKYPAGVVPFLYVMFDKLDTFNRGYGASTPKAVSHIIEGYVKEVLPSSFPYPSDIFTGAYLDASRIEFKYAINRRVTGAPFLHINHVNVDSIPMKANDLAALLKQYL